ncbi:hypothetical protein [Mucilaginibacter endophyticus]|uniref:hypothetical protein n=1 Tax=Mucilaginibacter endophyticus TaxID=2675003 RepID=UPI0012B16F8E|nr:hypothetical protein [Mucilaginibacter endophyticus]
MNDNLTENGNQPLTTQGDTDNKADQLGGTTNLPPEQLKKEGGISSSDEDNPYNISDPDDLHEIRVGDDIGEPDPEGFQPNQDNDGAAESQSAGLQDAQQIIDGARNEDQLDRLKENAEQREDEDDENL